MKNNALKYLVVAALLANTATLLFFWLKRPPRGDRPKPPFEILTQELQLNTEQQKAFTLLHKQHHHVHDSLLQSMAEKRKVLYTQKTSQIDSIVQQIGLIQQEIEVITYYHFEDVRKICTPEQQTKLDNILVRSVQHVLMPKGNKQPPPHKD